LSVPAVRAYLFGRRTRHPPTRFRFIIRIQGKHMRTPLAAAAAFLALACAAAVPAGAQPTLRLGQSVQGRLASGDPAHTERGRFKVYQFRAQPGVRYVAHVQSGEFDALVRLARNVGGITDYIASDDDGGPDNGARLRFQVPAAGTYLLVAQSVAREGLGAFTILLDTAATRLPTPREVRVGESIRGELTDADAEYSEAGEGLTGFYDLYRLQATAGQRLRISMGMEEFAPQVAIGTVRDGEFVGLETSSGSTGILTFRVPEDGEYYVQAGAYGEATGSYALRIEERRAVPQPRATPIRRGQTVTGALRTGDPELEDGRWHDAYAYTGRAGERIRISLASDEFDTVLMLGRVVDGEFHELESNDDADDGDGTDSRITIELPEDGRYVIQATSFRARTEGAYRLTVGAPR
jgi:hypothetical protein